MLQTGSFDGLDLCSDFSGFGSNRRHKTCNVGQIQAQFVRTGPSQTIQDRMGSFYNQPSRMDRVPQAHLPSLSDSRLNARVAVADLQAYPNDVEAGLNRGYRPIDTR